MNRAADVRELREFREFSESGEFEFWDRNVRRI